MKTSVLGIILFAAAILATKHLNAAPDANATAPTSSQTMAPTQPPVTAAVPEQGASDTTKNAFALGYCLEYIRLHAEAFVEGVKDLKAVNDDGLAADMVTNLVSRGEALRRMEGDALGRSAKLIHAIGGSQVTEQWAETNAATLPHPFELPKKRTDTPESVLTDHLTAIIDDTSRVQKEILDQLPGLTSSLQSVGPDTVWTSDLGSYTAELSLWDGDPQFLKGLQQSAGRLVDGEPPGVPARVDHALRAILPSKPSLPSLQSGTGNLATLLPSRATETSVAALHAAPGELIDVYAAKDLTSALEDEHYSVILPSPSDVQQ